MKKRWMRRTRHKNWTIFRIELLFRMVSTVFDSTLKYMILAVTGLLIPGTMEKEGVSSKSERKAGVAFNAMF
jgi:hypothetical protein